MTASSETNPGRPLSTDAAGSSSSRPEVDVRLTAEDREFLQDVLAGLAQPSKQLQPKYFYDERGSELFDRITELPEYYLTRTEQVIMRAHADAMARQIGSDVMLIEFGSGSSVKTRKLLDQLETPAAYVPIDLSEEHLLKTAESLRRAYPDLEVLPLVADFTKPFELPTSQRTRSHAAVYFPGSTIGNFVPQDVIPTLAGIADLLGEQGGLLIGIDLQKEPATIEAAYNDARGVTAEFNLNLLHRINRELGADFDVEEFSHQASYNEALGRVEMFLVSLRQQTVTIQDRRFDFTAGERVLTEYSHKYTVAGFAQMAAEAGFALHESWIDPEQLFAVLHLVAD